MYKAKHFAVMPAAAWAQAVMQHCAFILAANWLCQGVRGMGRKELAFRLGGEIVLGFSLAAAALLAGVSAVVAIAGGLVLAHTANFALNGHVWVCVRYCALYRQDPERLRAYCGELQDRLRAVVCVEEALIFGSGARALHARSDIDLRLFFPRGVAAWLRVNLLLLRLRADAFLRGLPLDLYAYDDVHALARHRQDEPVRILRDRHGRLRQLLGARAIEGASS